MLRCLDQRCILGWIPELPNPAEARIAMACFCAPLIRWMLVRGKRPKIIAGWPWTRKGGV